MPHSKETFLRAVDELVDARVRADDLAIRQAAEKAWLAVVEATDWYLVSRHNIRVNPDERAHVERRRAFHNLDRGDWERTYGYLSQSLHGDIFYLGEPVSPSTIRGYFEEAAKFIEETTGEAGLVQAVWERLPNG